jgi:hypothetical protein
VNYKLSLYELTLYVFHILKLSCFFVYSSRWATCQDPGPQLDGQTGGSEDGRMDGSDVGGYKDLRMNIVVEIKFDNLGDIIISRWPLKGLFPT